MNIKRKLLLTLTIFIFLFMGLTANNFYHSTSKLMTSTTSQELLNYSSLGLSLIEAHYPGDWYIENDQLHKGDTLMNDNFKVIDSLSDQVGITATLFAKDTRIATSVIDESGKRAVGTKASDVVSQTVLEKGETYLGNAIVVGRDASTYYIPLKDKDNQIIGMWYVGIFNDLLHEQMMNAIYKGIIFIVLICVVGLAIAMIFAHKFTKFFTDSQDALIEMQTGSITFGKLSAYAHKKDEVGSIARSFDSMQHQIFSMITSIQKESNRIIGSSTQISQGMETVHNDIEDISATTEELSAGMEETSASSQEMSATTITIESEIEGVASKTEEGQKLSLEIKDRADNLKTVALDSQRNATDLYNATNTKLRSSIERASAIEEIKSLSQTIASLANQTNLLALNASIEAARAGEAGRGFAVVAHEIGQLANSSQKAVSKIETITQELSQAVEDMIEDSNSLLDFVDNKVIPDYGVLVQTGEQYSHDANAVEDMMTIITKSTTQLYESIQYLRNTITEVVSATEEGSKGSSEIAERSSSIFNQTNAVLELASHNLNIANELNTLVQFFSIKE